MDNKTIFLLINLITVFIIFIISEQILDAPIRTVGNISELDLTNLRDTDTRFFELISDKLRKQNTPETTASSSHFTTTTQSHFTTTTQSHFTTTTQSHFTTTTQSHFGFHHCNQTFLSQHYMTLSYGKGRLGNQLFQVLSLLGTALNHCYTPVITHEFTNRLNKVIDLSFIGNISQIPGHWKEFNDGPPSKYSTGIKKLDHRSNWTLNGFFQSWRYFDLHKRYITSVLKFSKNVTESVSQYINSTTEFKSKTKICVHYRRGDFLRDHHRRRGFSLASTGYLDRSMRYFSDKLNDTSLVFIFISDTIDWCKKNVKNATGNVYYSPFSSSNSLLSAGYDMALMTQCDHCIITSGTFGWIGAWLGKGHVVYYKDYPAPGSRLENGLNKTDYYPPYWIGMV